MTINDVAAHAGVGAGTVSRVLNDSPKVRPATRDRVLAAIELLDYRPNPLARGLSRGRCQTIGVVVPSFTQPSAIERMRGVVAALHGSPYDLVLFDVESPLHRDEHFATLNRQRADGLLVVSLAPPPRDLARLLESGMAVVLIDARGEGTPMVVTDDVEGGRIATRHIAASGHKRIAFIGDLPNNPFGFTSSAFRERGYRETLADAGIEVRPEYVCYAPHERLAARRATERLLALREPPTAVFAASDVQAMGVIETARAAGLRVPGDVSVVGFDDIELAAFAGITTVRQPLFHSGELGARLLLDALGNGAHAAPEVHELPLELVIRSTTSPLPRARRTERIVHG